MNQKNIKDEKIEQDVQEDFSKIRIKQNKFSQTWCIWELYSEQEEAKNEQKLEENKDKNEIYFKQDLNKIYTIENIEEFLNFFSVSLYATPSKLFSSSLNVNQTKKFKVDDKFNQIESILMFRIGIQPEWEDKQVSGSFKINLLKNTFQQIDQLWNHFSCYLLSYPQDQATQMISGIKLISKRKMHVQNRLEIWMNEKYDDKNLETKQQLINLIEKTMVMSGLKMDSIKILDYEHFNVKK